MKETQRQKVLRLLKEAGPLGVSSYEFTYSHAVKQAPARILELKRLGHTITDKPSDQRSVRYFLVKDITPVPVKYEIVKNEDGIEVAKQVEMDI